MWGKTEGKVAHKMGPNHQCHNLLLIFYCLLPVFYSLLCTTLNTIAPHRAAPFSLELHFFGASLFLSLEQILQIFDLWFSSSPLLLTFATVLAVLSAFLLVLLFLLFFELFLFLFCFCSVRAVCLICLHHL
eukprot:NODE_1912_length_1358_cov_21.161192_g1731_i0.p1 GENE.NODE_1912_length_1358_cov_21.161192_g1731_i0~~NODE_1912_length_1358_cov_21.161192_g1731_i0.p1  ORF type:complete len:131 (-),score=19.50 NODE_1912_length_1358_cov_21.161192_g1731_i0:2-394(-)